MASKFYTYQTVDNKTVNAVRSVKQGRGKSPDPLTAITVRLPKSWLDEMENPRHEIFVAVKDFRTRKLLNY